jgi:hypothetical protein
MAMVSLPSAASGQWMLGARVASLKSIELGPQQQVPVGFSSCCVAEALDGLSLDVTALTLLSSPYSVSE